MWRNWLIGDGEGIAVADDRAVEGRNAMSSLMVAVEQQTSQQSSRPADAFVGACALVFTVASFWWLNARQGRLKSWEPLTFSGSVTYSPSRIRFPVVLYN